MQVNSVSPNSTAVNSKALISIKNRGYFNPAQSRSSYKLLNAFENESYGIKTLCDLYDVKAVFTTKWFKEHPLYDIDNCEWDFKGSYAQLDLIVKRIKVSLEKSFINILLESKKDIIVLTLAIY